MERNSRHETHRFLEGEKCPKCPSKRWYWENGFQYCAAHGHRIEGVIQIEHGDEGYGTTGRIFRKEREAREQEKLKLSGRQARDLYLECLQLLLRKQIEWLIDVKGLKAELETVVRDLWDLRIRGSPAALVDEPTSDGEMSVFSSQVELSEEESHSRASSRDRRVSDWSSNKGDAWPTPRVSDTLALCYLGCLLLRIPIRIGDFVRWARGGNVVYKQPHRHIPKDIWDRLPATYQRLFQSVELSSLDDGELHSTVMNLALSYRMNYGMEFPPLNDVLVTLQYVRELCLPIETVSVARRIPPIMELSYKFPEGTSRIRAIYHPEILLVSVIVLATQYCFPFEEVALPDQHGNYVQIPELDWAKWEALMVPILNNLKASEDNDFDTATVEDITSMTPEQLDKYFSYMSLQINTGAVDEFLTDLFPLEAETYAPPPRPEEPEQTLNKRAVEVQFEAVAFDKFSAEERSKAGGRYYSYRRLEDLPSSGRVFYELAARFAGLSTLSLLKAVNMLETQVRGWKRWQKKRASTARSRAQPVDDIEAEASPAGPQ